MRGQKWEYTSAVIEVGGWIGVVVETAGKVMEALDRFPATDTDKA